MAAIFKRLFNIEREEIPRAVLMFLYAFLLLSAYLILKPVRNSLFLNRFGADQLIYMYMIIAAAATPIASLYGWTAARTSLPRLVGWTTAIIIVNLALFWYLIAQQYSWLVYVFYVWVSLFGVFTTSQFWLLANYVFDAREAKRVFPFCAAGAIVGGITGSLLTKLFAELLGTENLLWLCVAFLLICFGILLTVWRMRPRDDTADQKGRKKVTSAKGMLPVMLKSRHLRLLALMIGLTVMVSTLVDFQFNKVVNDAFDDKDKLTAFFGFFFFWLSLISLVLQLLFSSRILRRFGVGVAILFLPVGLLLGSAAIFIAPVLASAVLVKISDGSFRYSINKTGLELLYLPVATNIKDRVKAFMDVVGDRFARGIGGGLLFIVNDLLSWPVQWISFLSAALIAGWIAVAMLIKREYSQTFRSALDTRLFDTDTIRTRLHDAASIEEITHTLESGSRRQILFVLELISHERDTRLMEPLTTLLNHSDAGIRRTALAQLAIVGDETMSAIAEPLLEDTDPDVVAEAIHVLCATSSDNGRALYTRLKSGGDPVLTAAACRCAVQYHLGSEAREAIDTRQIETVLADEGRVGRLGRRHLSEALKYVDTQDPLIAYLPKLLADPAPKTRRNALMAAARLRTEFLPVIIGNLGDAHFRKLAADALVQIGPEILPELVAHLNDPNETYLVKLRIPAVIAAFGTTEAAECLVQQVDKHNGLLRYNIVRGLGRMRHREILLPIDREKVTGWIRSEAESYYRLSIYFESITAGTGDAPSNGLLRRAIDERRKMRLNQIFRMSGLLYPSDDMYFAYRGILSDSRVIRARAVEFLDTIWERRIKEPLFPILEGNVRLDEAGRQLFKLPRLTREKTLKELLAGDDHWLASCAAFVIGRERLSVFADDLKQLLDVPHLALSESARTALKAVAHDDDRDV